MRLFIVEKPVEKKAAKEEKAKGRLKVEGQVRPKMKKSSHLVEHVDGKSSEVSQHQHCSICQNN